MRALAIITMHFRVLRETGKSLANYVYFTQLVRQLQFFNAHPRPTTTDPFLFL